MEVLPFCFHFIFCHQKGEKGGIIDWLWVRFGGSREHPMGFWSEKPRLWCQSAFLFASKVYTEEVVETSDDAAEKRITN